MDTSYDYSTTCAVSQTLSAMDEISSAFWSLDRCKDDAQITFGEPCSVSLQKIRKQRMRLSLEQFTSLEYAYAENHYLTREKYLHLSKTLNIKKSQIRNWFQNRRSKEKKISRKLTDPAKHAAGNYIRGVQTIRDSPSRAASDNTVNTTNDNSSSSSSSKDYDDNGYGSISSSNGPPVESREVHTYDGRRQWPVFVDHPLVFVGQPPVRSPWTPRSRPPHFVPRHGGAPESASSSQNAVDGDFSPQLPASRQ